MEDQIQSLERYKTELEDKMALPDNYSDFEKLHSLTEALDTTNRELEELHRNWEELFITLDELGEEDL